jgi:hypothetical protein
MKTKGALVVALALLLLVAPALAAPASLSSETTTSGAEATVTYTLENTGENSSGYVIDIVEMPDGYRFVEQSSERGVWKNSTKVWFFQSVDGGSTVTASMTVRAASGEAGSPLVVANAVDDEGKRDSTEVTLQATVPGGEGGGPLDALPVSPTVILLSVIVVLLLAILAVQLRG